jgi:electron transfer flavoprotein beta subunit
VDVVVLIKQVPATESLIDIAPDGISINTADIKYVISPYDEIAVEEAIRIKEAVGGTVTAVSVGPDKAQEAIRTALAMGVDKGILINDPATRGMDGLGVAKVLAAVVKTISFDLIIAGQRAVDDDNFLVGTAVAEYLGIPNISLVNKQEMVDGKFRCQRTIEGGTVVLEAAPPLLITTQRGLNEPRYASLPGIMKAKRKPLEVKTLADFGIDPGAIGAGTKILGLSRPAEKRIKKIIDADSPAAKAAELVRLLHEEAKVI